jgi:hypothetical protein
MATVTGVYRHGHVDLAEPVTWPEGAEVTVRLAADEFHMMREEDWPSTHEGWAEHAQRIAELEPVELTPADEAEIAAARAAVKEFTIAAVRRQMGLDP